MSVSIVHKRLPLINALLIALLLFGQAAYGLHDGESLDGKHSHSVECPVCLSERYAGVESMPMDILPASLPDALPQLLSAAAVVAHLTLPPAIRAPPLFR